MIQYYIEYTSGINFTNLFSFLNVTIRKCKIGEREMAQRIKAHVVQPDNMVERENWLPQAVLRAPHGLHGIHVHIYTNV